MPVVALTDSNLKFIKHRLLAAAPHVRSSHMSEAIAAGFGYQTNAALRSERDLTKIPMKIGQGIERLFNQRLLELSRTDLAVSLFDSILWSEAMPDRVWRVFEKDERHAIDSWFYDCQRRNSPCVWITRRRKLVRLEWDCISIEPPSDARIVSNDNLGHIFYRAFMAIASGNKRAYFCGKAFVGSIDNLLPDEARRLADGICLMLDGAINRTPFDSHLPTLHSKRKLTKRNSMPIQARTNISSV